MKKYSRRKRYRRMGQRNFFIRLWEKTKAMLLATSVKQRVIGASCSVVVVVLVVTLSIVGAAPSGQAAAADGAEARLNVEDAQAVEPTAAPTPVATPAPTPTPTPDPTLEEGMENERVNQLQERLMDLGYLDIDETTNYFGSATKYAVQLFQRQHELDMDGIAGPLTLEMIYSDEAKQYTLLEGTTGTDVTSFQERLRELGYLDKVTGYYGTETIEAVKAFQERNDLAVDGKAGENTFNLIYSPNAVESADKVAEERRTGNINNFIAAAEEQLGDPYILGAAGPNTFDCSGLVTYCLRQAGSTTGRYNAAGFSQNERWERIDDIDNLQRGDLIFFYNNARSKIGHVGIIIGNGMMIDASSANGEVVKRSYLTSYWRSVFYCGRRPW